MSAVRELEASELPAVNVIRAVADKCCLGRSNIAALERSQSRAGLKCGTRRIHRHDRSVPQRKVCRCDLFIFINAEIPFNLLFRLFGTVVCEDEVVRVVVGIRTHCDDRSRINVHKNERSGRCGLIT